MLSDVSDQTVVLARSSGTRVFNIQQIKLVLRMLYFILGLYSMLILVKATEQVRGSTVGLYCVTKGKIHLLNKC